MKRIFKTFGKLIQLFGFNFRTLFNTLRGIPYYIKSYFKIRRQRKDNQDFPFGQAYPVFNDRYEASGVMSGHYFHQDLYVAKKIFKNNPEHHLDIGSRTDGFVAHVAVFREIEVIDIREQKSKVENITFRQADLMQLPSELINYCDSVSALHSLEHFGLGRYNDPIDYYGFQKAIENITRILKPEGKFYFSVPIGKQRIEFNAQRVFSVEFLFNLLKEKFIITEFSFIDDAGNFNENYLITPENLKTNFNCKLGCGIFVLIKK